MAISSFDDYIASGKQLTLYKKTGTRTSVAQIPYSIIDLAGTPGAGLLAGANTANGVVPTDATAGFPLINAFAGGAKGYLSRASFWADRAMTLTLVDVLFKAGAYAFNANTTLGTQPSYSGRVPGGTDYTGCELWLEAVVAFTGNQSIRIQYLDQDGNAGDTGTITTGVAPASGRVYQMPLASGDTGVSRVDVVTSTVSTTGTFNVLVVRPLLTVRIPAAGTGIDLDLLRTGMPEIFADSALALYVRPDSTSTGSVECYFEVANK
jgi:hypothetical protein